MERSGTLTEKGTRDRDREGWSGFCLTSLSLSLSYLPLGRARHADTAGIYPNVSKRRIRASSSCVGAGVSATVGAERRGQPVCACTSSQLTPVCRDSRTISPDSAKPNTPRDVTTLLGPPPDRPTVCRQPW